MNRINLGVEFIYVKFGKTEMLKNLSQRAINMQPKEGS